MKHPRTADTPDTVLRCFAVYDLGNPTAATTVIPAQDHVGAAVVGIGATETVNEPAATLVAARPRGDANVGLACRDPIVMLVAVKVEVEVPADVARYGRVLEFVQPAHGMVRERDRNRDVGQSFGKSRNLPLA